MSTKPLITHTRLLELLTYDPDQGTFRWRVAKARIAPMGSLAGNITDEGYRRIGVEHRDYMAHRLAWFYIHGTWPIELDHINGNPGDNRLSNLRECSRAQNLATRKLRKGKEMPKGVARSGRKFEANITTDKKRRYLGVFATVDEAHSAYLLAAEQRWGAFANSGAALSTAKPGGE